jgi:hypothetical protein
MIMATRLSLRELSQKRQFLKKATRAQRGESLYEVEFVLPDGTKTAFTGENAIPVTDKEKATEGVKKDVIGVQIVTQAEGAEAEYTTAEWDGSVASGYTVEYPTNTVYGENGTVTYRLLWSDADEGAPIPDENIATTTVATGTPAACGYGEFTYETVPVRYERGADIVSFNITFRGKTVYGTHDYAHYKTWAETFTVDTDATHSTTGVAYAKCKCGNYETDNFEIPKLDDHVFLKDSNDKEVVITVGATCEHPGYKYRVCTTEDNGWVLATDDKTYNLKDAEGNTVDYVAKSDFNAAVLAAAGETKAADAKHPVLVEGSVTEKADHKFVISTAVKDSDWDTTTNPEDITVEVEQLCTVCKGTYDVTYHSASAPETAVATDVDEINVYDAITSETTVGKDCSEQNTITYSVNGAPEAVTLTENLASYGPHSYKNTVTFSKDGKTATVTQQCTFADCAKQLDIDGNARVKNASAVVTSSDNEDGSTTYKATFGNEVLGTKKVFDLTKAVVTINGGETLDVNTIPYYEDADAQAKADAKDGADEAQLQNEQDAEDADANIAVRRQSFMSWTYEVYNKTTGDVIATYTWQQGGEQAANEKRDELGEAAAKAVRDSFDYNSVYNDIYEAELAEFLDETIKDYTVVTINGAVIDPDLYSAVITAPHFGKLVEGANKITVTADPDPDAPVAGSTFGVVKCITPGTLYTVGALVDGKAFDYEPLTFDGKTHTFEAAAVYNGDYLEVEDAAVSYAVIKADEWTEEFDPSTLSYDKAEITDAGDYVVFAKLEKEGYTTKYDYVCDVTVNAKPTGKTITVQAQLIKYGDALVVTTGDAELDKTIGLSAEKASQKGVGEYKLTELVTWDPNYEVRIDETATVSIEKRNAKVVLKDTTKTYDGTEIDPSTLYTVDGVVNGDDLEVIVNTEGDKKVATEPGTYKLIATANNANYNIEVVPATLKINKIAQKVTKVSPTKKVYTADKKSGKLKKKQTFTLTAKTEGDSTAKVTFKKTKGNKKITVSSKGKVTVKKNLKKGKYTVKVKVTKAATAHYAAASKTVKVTVTVK